MTSSFDERAKTWDEQPRRVQLARDIFAAHDCQAQCANDHGVCPLHDQKRQRNTNSNDGKRRKPVAHDCGEQRHANAVNRNCNKAAALRNDGRNPFCNDITHACGSKQRAQSSQQLRQNANRADIIHQAGTVRNCCFCRRFGNKE